MSIKEISIKDIKGVSIGHAQSEAGKTGVTVVYFPDGAQAGCESAAAARHPERRR